MNPVADAPHAAGGALRLWALAARPRTLPAAVAPVLVGTALAIVDDEFKPLAFVAALIGSIFIQIGTNLSNDYSDARRGADTEDRLGPVRVTAGGLMPPRRVLVGTYVAFGIEAWSRMAHARSRRDAAEMGRLVDDGRIALVADRTPVQVVGSGTMMLLVRVLAGPHEGREVWVRREFVRPAPR